MFCRYNRCQFKYEHIFQAWLIIYAIIYITVKAHLGLDKIRQPGEIGHNDLSLTLSVPRIAERMLLIPALRHMDQGIGLSIWHLFAPNEDVKISCDIHTIVHSISITALKSSPLSASSLALTSVALLCLASGGMRLFFISSRALWAGDMTTMLPGRYYRWDGAITMASRRVGTRFSSAACSQHLHSAGLGWAYHGLCQSHVLIMPLAHSRRCWHLADYWNVIVWGVKTCPPPLQSKLTINYSNNLMSTYN